MSRVEWDSGTLSIWFTGSGKYHYYNVPEALYESLLEARSKGTF
ncbi:KTSC domain-containing protein [Yoonia ponticola]